MIVSPRCRHLIPNSYIFSYAYVCPAHTPPNLVTVTGLHYCKLYECQLLNSRLFAKGMGEHHEYQQQASTLETKYHGNEIPLVLSHAIHFPNTKFVPFRWSSLA